MAYLILIFGVLSLASFAQAQKSFFTGPERFDAYYEMVCGSAHSKIDTPEINQARHNFQSFLKNPQEYTEAKASTSPEHRLQGSAAYDLYVLCQSVLSFKTRLNANPCQDEKGLVIDPSPALDFCSQQKYQY